MTSEIAPPPTAVAGHFGRVFTARASYRPLETVTVTVRGRSKGDTACRIEVRDPQRNVLREMDVALENNLGRCSFPATGALGTHYVYLYWPDEEKHRGYVNYVLEADTSIETGDEKIDLIYPLTRDNMPRGRRAYHFPEGKFVGYISADTNHHDGIWLRDSVYGLPAYQHWECDLTCMLDRFLDRQEDTGRLPDGIERNGKTWRVGIESDVEYIMVMAVWQSWKANGDDAWLKRCLPKLEKALEFITSDPRHWDPQRKMIKRQHSCDTWDFDIDGAGESGNDRHVIATCDQAGYVLAFNAMAAMYDHVGEQQLSRQWQAYCDDYRSRAVELLWDGEKFLHHVHISEIDHGDFDESQQLAMGNTWAITRGMADQPQARQIVDTYKSRHAQTGDAYPWWSLQPGYPDHLNYFAKRTYLRQGGYANGGLMPWVGGELCYGAFTSGREAYAIELLHQYGQHLQSTGEVQVWYWPDGKPGHRTPNEVGYAGWGMGQWIDALMSGLAGIEDPLGQLRRPRFSPRFAAADLEQVNLVFRYAASDAYLACQYEAANDQITLRTTGSGESIDLRLLLPAGREAASLQVNGKAAEAVTETVDQSTYLVITMPATSALTVVLA